MKRGFTLIEILIYTTLLAVLLIAAVQIIFMTSRNVAQMKIERSIFTAAEGSMETLIREVRQASDVIASSSNFGTSPGTLVLRTVQAPGGSAVINRSFGVNSQRLVKNDGGADEFLTPPEVRISELFFWHSSSSSSAAIMIKMTVEAGSGDNLKAKSFYGTAVLRAKY